MRKVVVGEFLSLDGVMGAPERWQMPFMDREAMAYLQEQFVRADALLLGRKTYEEFAAHFASASSEQNPFAGMMNQYLKYVVSTTLDKAEWNNSTLIKDNVVEEITRLKQQPGKNINISGSGTLVRSLMPHSVIDEYQLWVHPVVAGSGKHLFEEGMDLTILKHAETRTFGSGVVVLVYHPK